jgi:hypothetical protein
MESVILTFNLLQLLFYFESKISEVQKSPKFLKFKRLQNFAKKNKTAKAKVQKLQN